MAKKKKNRLKADGPYETSVNLPAPGTTPMLDDFKVGLEASGVLGGPPGEEVLVVISDEKYAALSEECGYDRLTRLHFLKGTEHRIIRIMSASQVDDMLDSAERQAQS